MNGPTAGGLMTSRIATKSIMTKSGSRRYVLFARTNIQSFMKGSYSILYQIIGQSFRPKEIRNRIHDMPLQDARGQSMPAGIPVDLVSRHRDKQARWIIRLSKIA